MIYSKEYFYKELLRVRKQARQFKRLLLINCCTFPQQYIATNIIPNKQVLHTDGIRTHTRRLEYGSSFHWDLQYCPCSTWVPLIIACGRGEIRTRGPRRVDSLAESWFKPLTHPSKMKYSLNYSLKLVYFASLCLQLIVFICAANLTQRSSFQTLRPNAGYLDTINPNSSLI